MISTSQEALTDAELDQLEALLDSPAFGGESMTLDALQGFLCAVASAPDPIVPSDWMPIALGSKTRFESEAQAQAFMELLLRFYDQQVAALQGEGAASLIVYRDESSGEDDLDTWCQGYLEGVDLSPRAWEEAGDPDEVDELLFPFLVLTGELSEEARSRVAAKDWDKLVEACRDDIWATAVDAHRYWRAQRERPATVRREQPKVGRNDPCSCGSGKKFKQCCGAPHSLH